MYFLLGVGCGLFMGYFFRTEIHDIYRVYSTFKKNVMKNTVVPQCFERWIPPVVISWLETGKFLLDVGCVYMEQKLTSSCIPLEKTPYFSVRFVIHNRLYAIVVRPLRGPQEEYIIVDHNINDITRRIEPYILGSQAVVTELTPSLFGETEYFKIAYVSETKPTRIIQANEKL